MELSNPMKRSDAPDEGDPRYCDKCGFLLALHEGDGRCPAEELTAAEIKRQDDVDNTVIWLIEDARRPFGRPLNWLFEKLGLMKAPDDIELYAEYRDEIYLGTVKDLKVTERQWYPYVGPDDEQSAA